MPLLFLARVICTARRRPRSPKHPMVRHPCFRQASQRDTWNKGYTGVVSNQNCAYPSLSVPFFFFFKKKKDFSRANSIFALQANCVQNSTSPIQASMKSNIHTHSLLHRERSQHRRHSNPQTRFLSNPAAPMPPRIGHRKNNWRTKRPGSITWRKLRSGRLRFECRAHSGNARHDQQGTMTGHQRRPRQARMRLQLSQP
jgi:hypothetical protein